MQGSRRKQTLKMWGTGRSLQKGASSSVGRGMSAVWFLLGMGHGVQGHFGFTAWDPSKHNGSGAQVKALTQQFWAASVTKAADNPSLCRPGLGAVRQGSIRQTWRQAKMPTQPPPPKPLVGGAAAVWVKAVRFSASRGAGGCRA